MRVFEKGPVLHMYIRVHVSMYNMASHLTHTHTPICTCKYIQRILTRTRDLLEGCVLAARGALALHEPW